MLSILKRLLKRRNPGAPPDLRLDDTDMSWLDPPTDPLDTNAWDRYWMEHIEHGLGPPVFDMVFDDRDLVSVMNEHGMRTVLCAGNGISQEPRALAEAGFDVVALDLSPRAVEIAKAFDLPPEGFESFCDPEHRCEGGRLEFAVGDILDATAFPGPFDVVIERRTAQTFFGRDIGGVLSALSRRLDQSGIFVSHCHDGGWRPPAEPRHYTAHWFEENGWEIWNGPPDSKPPGRVAWLLTTTG